MMFSDLIVVLWLSVLSCLREMVLWNIRVMWVFLEDGNEVGVECG